MEPTLKEDLSHTIIEHHRAILFSAETIQWFEKYGNICDQLINRILEKRTTETNIMTEDMKNAWENIPGHLEEELLKKIVNQFNSKVYIIMPPPFISIVNRLKKEIPIRRELINELRNIRDNGIAEILEDYSKNCDKSRWENSSQTIQKIIEENWKKLAKLTISLNNTVMFVNRYCPQFWRDLTYSWSRDYFIC